MKKINFVINSLHGGGTEKVCRTLAESISNRGWLVNIFVFDNESDISLGNANIYFMGKTKASRSLNSFKNIFEIVDDGIFLVFNHELALALSLYKVISKKNICIVSRINNTLSVSVKYKKLSYRIVVNNLMKLFYRRMDMYVCQSQGIKNDLIDNYNVKGPFKVIGNPIDFSNTASTEKSKDIKKILYVGRLVEQKNISDIIKVFSNLSSNDQTLRLQIVGDGPEKMALKKQVAEMNITEKVSFVGHVDDPTPYFIDANVTLLTSFNEGFPNVLLESINHGTPVVSYDLPSGPSEIIVDNLNGYLVPHLSTCDLELAVIKSLNKSWCRDELQHSILKYETKKITNDYIDCLELLRC